MSFQILQSNTALDDWLCQNAILFLFVLFYSDCFRIYVICLQFITLCFQIVIPHWASQGLSNKESACQCKRRKRHEFYPWVGTIPWSRKQQLTCMFLPGKFHGQRSLVGYSPWSCNESDTTEYTHTHTPHCLQHKVLITVYFSSLPSVLYIIVTHIISMYNLILISFVAVI